ncbi:COG1361 S-layer family protein [Streptomyces sp. NPDC002754]
MRRGRWLAIATVVAAGAAAPAAAEPSPSTPTFAASSASPQERAPRAAGPLRLEKTVTPDPLTVGGSGVYTLTVTNTGDESAHDVTVTDNLDAHLSPDGGASAGCTTSDSAVTCGGSGNDLAPGASATYEIPVTVDPSTTDGTNIVNHATATSSDAQSADAQTIAQTHTNVKLTKTAPATVDPDGSYDYTFTVTNEGPSDAVDVYVEDNTDGQDLDIQDLPAECPPSGTTVTCDLDTLAPGEERTFTVRVHAHDDVPAGTVIPNCADVYTGSRETVSADNHSCTTTAVTPHTAPQHRRSDGHAVAHRRPDRHRVTHLQPHGSRPVRHPRAHDKHTRPPRRPR